MMPAHTVILDLLNKENNSGANMSGLKKGNDLPFSKLNSAQIQGRLTKGELGIFEKIYSNNIKTMHW